MHSIMRGPSPAVDQDQGNKLTTMNQQWEDLRAEAKSLLDQIQFAESLGKSFAQFSEAS
ncbi:MAG: aspartyl/asparaginyl beta-hydroxylase (cupin superfamily) [Saprospiraceae bacterium]|jgi:aspartyl/asparaginyl beta-hydroxylase (cupin superfamily)